MPVNYVTVLKLIRNFFPFIATDKKNTGHLQNTFAAFTKSFMFC